MDTFVYHLNENEEGKALVGLWSQMHNDLVDIAGGLHYPQKRIFIIIFISMAEAVSFKIREYLLEKFNNKEITLTNEEYFALLEKSIQLDTSGKIKQIDRFDKFIKIFRLSIQLFAKHNKKEDVLERFIADDGYGKFQKTIAIRNRLTHPKKGSDLDIDDQEYIIAQTAHNWLHTLILEMLEGKLLTKK